MTLSIRTRIDNLKDEIHELEKQDFVTKEMVIEWIGERNMNLGAFVTFATDCVNQIPHMKRSVQDFWEDKLTDDWDWSKTTALWDGEDWLFAGVPPEAGWESGQTCFSERELGMCISPEKAIKALKAWVADNKGGM